MSFENSFVWNLNQQRSCMRFRYVALFFESVGVGVSSKNLGKKLKKETILLYFHSFHFKFNMLSKKCACVCSGLGEERPSQLLDNSLFYMKINDKCLLREKVGKAAPPPSFPMLRACACWSQVNSINSYRSHDYLKHHFDWLLHASVKENLASWISADACGHKQL